MFGMSFDDLQHVSCDKSSGHILLNIRTIGPIHGYLARRAKSMGHGPQASKSSIGTTKNTYFTLSESPGPCCSRINDTRGGGLGFTNTAGIEPNDIEKSSVVLCRCSI